MGSRLPGDPQRGGEADAVGVVAGVGGRLGPEWPDRVVAAYASPDLLEDEVGRLRVQHGPRSALVGLELVEDRLDLTTRTLRAAQLRPAGKWGLALSATGDLERAHDTTRGSATTHHGASRS